MTSHEWPRLKAIHQVLSHLNICILTLVGHEEEKFSSLYVYTADVDAPLTIE